MRVSRAPEDAARSLAAGEIVSNETEPQTIADGARNLSFDSGPDDPALGAGTYEVADDCFVTLVLELPVGVESPRGWLEPASTCESAWHFRQEGLSALKSVTGMVATASFVLASMRVTLPWP